MSAYSEAVREVGGLSDPSKMPSLSWSTPAKRCITGSALAKKEGTICHYCYAREGFYVLPSVEAAMERRFKRLKAALKGPESMRLFEAAWNTIFASRLRRTEAAIRRNGRPGRDDGRVWRWHDSGDLHGVEHLALYCRLAAANPQVAFWLPTKEAGTVMAYLVGRPKRGVPANLTIRLSVPQFNRGAPLAYLRMKARSPQVSFAAAHTEGGPPGGFQPCVAPSQGGFCADCRSCWTGASVSYAVHTAKAVKEVK